MSAQFPRLGVGLGYRPQLHDAIFRESDQIDWLELIAEDFLPLSARRRELLARLRERFICVPHCTELSLGSDAPVDLAQLSQLHDLVTFIDAPWFSDHLCFTTAGGVRLGHLAPVPWTLRNAQHMAQKARMVSQFVDRPFLLENITYYLVIPGELTEAEFIRQVVELADCHLLLDVTNVHTNATNLGFDSVEFLGQLPLDRVTQLHVAGGTWDGGVLVDSHDAAVPPAVWALVGRLADQASIPALLLERDAHFPADFTEILDDLRAARAAMAGMPI